MAGRFDLRPEDVRAAAERLRGTIPVTPCIQSRTLSRLTGAEVWLKFENQQFTASFKERGALNSLLCLTPEEQRRGVVTMSAGNHAQGLAYHAGRLGLRAVVVMPRYTPTVKVENTRILGAEVRLVGDTFDDCRAEVDRLIREHHLTLVHPFDDPRIMAGQGTLALEMLDQAPNLDALIVPVGGGGLLGGMTVAARDRRPDIRLFGVQTQAYPGVAARRAGRPPPSGASTIAEGIAVKVPGETALEIFDRGDVTVGLVEDEDIEDAILLLLDVEKTVVEGAGAAGLAWMLREPERFRGLRVGLPLTGGNVDLPILATVIQRGLVRGGRMARLRIEIRDVPGALASVARCIADAGANIVEVQHQRSFSALTVRQAQLDVELLARGREHVAEIVAALNAAGHRATVRND